MTGTASPHYVLIVDKKMDVIMHAFRQATAMSETGRLVFQQLCLQYGVTNEDLKSYFDDVTAKQHALGWCDDPNCKHNQHPKS